MAASPATAARLRFLNESAHLLSTTAPETALQLMSECRRLASKLELNTTDLIQSQLCASCGSIMIPGRTCHVFTKGRYNHRIQLRRITYTDERAERYNKRRKLLGVAFFHDQLQADGPAEINLAFKCLTCQHETVRKTERPESAASRRRRGQLHEDTGPTATEDPSAGTEPTSVNASSKKRAKTRKQSGLKAMLDKAKQDTANPPGAFGLDLMDMMNPA